MLEKNKVYEAVICDYTAEGQGIAKIEGCAVFIPNAIVGERCTVRIEKVGKTWAAGKLVELLEKSAHRVNRACPVAKLCGGCDFWHMDYQEECRLKADRVRQALNRIGGEALEEVPILSAPTCYDYRNKAQYPVASKKGRVFAGFFRAGTHQVVENQRCLILPEQTDRIKQIVVDYVNHYRISAYDETTHTGLLRHIYVRRGNVSGQILVCLVLNGRKLPHTQDLIQRLQAIEGFTSLVISVNTRPGNAILGSEFITLYGPGYIEDTLCGLTFRLSARSFYQVNHHQAQRLYEAAIAQAGITKEDLVLDLYCGVGTITLCMAKAAGRVIGVEVIEQAVEDAKANARRNRIENAEFFCGDAGKAALDLEEKGIHPDVVVVDPPRKGLNTDAIEAMAKMAPRRIVYVSCDPATLARDVALLKQKGYALQSAQCADLFPRCAHIESVVCLSRKTTHEMKLHASPFEKIKSGAKNIELRLFDEKRQKIKVGDDIIFTNTASGEKMRASVKKLHLFDSFEELYKSLPLLQCGYTVEDIDIAHPSDMEQYYSVEEQKKYGVVGIELFPPKRMTDESIVCLTRQDKLQSFFDNARLLRTVGITPLLYGSVGLAYASGRTLHTDDVDMLIPNAFLTTRWQEFRQLLEENGYVLTDEKEHVFQKDGIAFAYAQIEELETFAGIRPAQIATEQQEDVSFLLLSLPQYQAVYAASLQDGYRQEVRQKKDAEKLALIRSLLA